MRTREVESLTDLARICPGWGRLDSGTSMAFSLGKIAALQKLPGGSELRPPE